MMKEVEECIKEMAFKQSLDIVAHRKALEAALYDNMETPRQMLARCKYTASIDAEHHPVDGDDVNGTLNLKHVLANGRRIQYLKNYMSQVAPWVSSLPLLAGIFS